MNALLVAGLILGIGAPAPKEAPKKAPPSIVGMWETKTWTVFGMELHRPTLLEFTTDGQFNITQMERTQVAQHKYKLDATKDPAEVDQLFRGDEDQILKGIYKIDGDTLTVCIEVGFDSKRPTNFESVKGSRIVMWTLKRVEKKKE